MITISIDNRVENLADVDVQWIDQQISRRRDNGISPCVLIVIKIEPSINLNLSTPNTNSHFRGSSRHPSPEEQKLLSLWNDLHLNDQNYTIENMVLFIKKILELK